MGLVRAMFLLWAPLGQCLSLKTTAPVVNAYIHIPFCRRRCFYCDFPITVVGDGGPGDERSEKYVAMLEREALATAECEGLGAASAAAGGLQTVYLGGGTPSLLAPSLVERVLRGLVCESFGGLAPGCEVTLEMDPGTFDAGRLDAYLAAGVTRVSLGVQSWDAGTLEAAGRAHCVADAEEAVELLNRATCEFSARGKTGK